MDSSTRKILGWKTFPYNNGHLQAKDSDVIALLNDTFHAYQKPRSISTDQGGQFTSVKFKAFLERHNIQFKLAKGKLGIQIHERLHKTLFNYLVTLFKEQGFKERRKVTVYQLKHGTRPYLMQKRHEQIIQQLVNYYNNAENRMIRTTPVIMENALIPYLEAKPSMDPISSKRPLFLQLQDIKHQAILSYNLKWTQFFIEWRQQNQEQTQAIIKNIKETAETTIQTLKIEIRSKERGHRLNLHKLLHKIKQ